MQESEMLHTVTTTRRTNKIPTTKTEKSYQFRERDPDPVLVELRDKIITSRLSAEELAVKAMVSWTTINNILNFKTRRPQNYTVDAILKACGYYRKTTRIK
jgi:hypothetical protein